MNYENNRTNTEETFMKVEHHLVREPEYLSNFEVMTSFGFIKIMSIIWSPLILVLVVNILKNKVIKR